MSVSAPNAFAASSRRSMPNPLRFGQVLLLKNTKAKPAFKFTLGYWASMLNFPIPDYQESPKTQQQFDAFIKRYCPEAQAVKVYSDQRVLLTDEDAERLQKDLTNALKALHQDLQAISHCEIITKRKLEGFFSFKNRLQKKYPEAYIAKLNEKQAVVIPASQVEAFKTELSQMLSERNIPDISYVLKPLAEKILAHRYSCHQETETCTQTLEPLIKATLAQQYEKEKGLSLDLASLSGIIKTVRTHLQSPEMQHALEEIGSGANLQDEIIEPFLAKDPETRFKLPYPWELFKTWLSGQQP